MRGLLRAAAAAAQSGRRRVAHLALTQHTGVEKSTQMHKDLPYVRTSDESEPVGGLLPGFLVVGLHRVGGVLAL